jgi:membrane protease YdiL (CAAX protease family)
MIVVGVALPHESDLRRAAGVIGALGIAVAARAFLIERTTADPVVIGLAFGLALWGIALAVGRAGGVPSAGKSMPTLRALSVGALAGLGLVGLALVGRQAGVGFAFAPPTAFVPWAVATVVVASGEEVVLRGAAFDSIGRAAGVGWAVVATSLVFALIHVPLYGWQVVPLDFGVGLVLGALKVLTNRTAAPAAAHVIADLAAWWL